MWSRVGGLCDAGPLLTRLGRLYPRLHPTISSAAVRRHASRIRSSRLQSGAFHVTLVACVGGPVWGRGDGGGVGGGEFHCAWPRSSLCSGGVEVGWAAGAGGAARSPLWLFIDDNASQLPGLWCACGDVRAGVHVWDCEGKQYLDFLRCDIFSTRPPPRPPPHSSSRVCRVHTCAASATHSSYLCIILGARRGLAWCASTSQPCVPALCMHNLMRPTVTSRTRPPPPLFAECWDVCMCCRLLCSAARTPQ